MALEVMPFVASLNRAYVQLCFTISVVVGDRTNDDVGGSVNGATIVALGLA